VPVHYTYCAYVAIPDVVRREFTVREIKILKLCPPSTLPYREPADPEAKKTRMTVPEKCVVCGIEFVRDIFEQELTFEKATCGAVRCVTALESWLEDAIPLTTGVKDAQEELLTFLSTPLYHLLRNKWLASHKVNFQS
jgi:hypothetical protein